MKKLLFYITILICSITQAQDYNSYLAQAKEAIKDGNFRKAYDSSTKAVELNSSGVDARELRIKSCLTTSAPNERLETAIIDLNYLISQNVDAAFNYRRLGIAESELANNIYRFNRTLPNYQNVALSHYESALKAYNKAIDLVPMFADDLKYRISVAQEKIADLKS